jgi:two-component system, NarL family, sensor histidine kinase BarA
MTMLNETLVSENINSDTSNLTSKTELINKSNSKASFKRQLLLLFISSVIILTVATTIITSYKTSEIIEKSTVSTALQITKNFAKQAMLALLTDNTDNAQEALNSTLGFSSVESVTIARTDNTILLASSEQADIKQYIKIAQQKITESAFLLKELTNVWVFAAPVILKQDTTDEEMFDPNDDSLQTQNLGLVLITYNKYELQQIQRSIFINNLFIGAVISALLTFLLRFVILRMTKPLSVLSKSMKSARDFANYTKAEVSGAAEIQQIASTYNQMMTTLAEQNSALEKSHDTLESEVEIRTQELVVARDSALSASRHKSEFLANISHELRTPLQAIIGYTDLVREDLELECMDSQVEDLNKSIRSAHTLLALINNILDLAKIEAGRMDLNLKAVNIKNLVNETIETVLPMASANNNKLTASFGKLSSTLMVDRQKLMQIFLNLLSNACKFTKNGKISFDIYNDRYYLYFSVTDTGVGIAQNKLQYIFEQFTQVDGSQTRKFEGTGLGMAITQNFCELMNSDLSVESELNVGSVFSVKMPIIED